MGLVQSLVDTYKYLKKNLILAGYPTPFDIARGKIAGSRSAQVEGYVTGIIVGAKDVSELGVTTIPTPSLSGVNMEVVSTSENDTLAGSNSQIVVIEYIEPVTEILTQVEVNLNGLTPVAVGVPIAFVSDFYVKQGNNLDSVSAGDIKLQSIGGATVYSVIKAGGNKSLQLYRYVPKGKDFYIDSMVVTGNSKAGSVRLRATQNDNLTKTNCFLFRSVVVSSDGSTDIHFDPPLVITEQNYIKATMFGTSQDNAGIVSVMINGWLENKNPRTLN